MSVSNEEYLSFHDAWMSHADFDSLNEGGWLTDAVIAMVYEYLTQQSLSEQCLFVPPSTAQLLSSNLCASEDLHAMLLPLDLSQREFIFLPINDNDNFEEVQGGSHWTLLAYNSGHNCCYFLNSSTGGGESKARRLTKVVSDLLSISNPSHIPLSFQILECPQQTNASDCGVFVLAFSEHLATQWTATLEACSSGFDLEFMKEKGVARTKRDFYRAMLEFLKRKNKDDKH